MAKVSILVPTYNVAPYLNQCMDSILSQTLTDLEVIAINDGSTDTSLDILNSYAEKDARVKILDGPNGGYGKAMNRGLDAASGTYIGIVEPDDFILPHMYETLYDKAAAYDLDFIKADFYRFTGDDPAHLQKTYVPLSPDGTGYHQVLCPYDHLEVFKFVLNTWSGIYRRAFLEEHQIRHHETPGASYQDNGFWFQTFALAERVMFLDTPCYMNRRDNPNSSVHDRKKVYCMNEEYDFIRRFLNAHPDICKHFLGVYHYKRYHNYTFTFQRIDDSFRKEYAERFAAEFRKAKEMGELDESLFSARDLSMLNLLLTDPLKYYYWKDFANQILDGYPADIQQLKKELAYVKKLKNSALYRPARKILRGVKKLLH